MIASLCIAQDKQPTWSGVLEKCEEAGINIAQIMATLRLCTEINMPASTAHKILTPVYSIKNDPVMHTLLLEKVEEGVSKKAGPDFILAAIDKRRQAVISAQRILAHNLKKSESTELNASITYAIESGLSSLTIMTIVQYGDSLSPEKLRTSIDAAELLHLAGINEEKTLELIKKHIDRKLEISEIKKIAAEKETISPSP